MYMGPHNGLQTTYRSIYIHPNMKFLGLSNFQLMNLYFQSKLHVKLFKRYKILGNFFGGKSWHWSYNTVNILLPTLAHLSYRHWFLQTFPSSCLVQLKSNLKIFFCKKKYSRSKENSVSLLYQRSNKTLKDQIIQKYNNMFSLSLVSINRFLKKKMFS